MKQFFLVATLLVIGFSNAQVKIGSNPTTMNPASLLELESTTQGFLLPRMTYVQKTSIASPPAGLQVWCTDCGSGELQVYNGTSWITYNTVAGVFAKPDAPTSPVAIASNSQASVAFSAPASNGGSAITGYTVTSSPGGLTATGASSPLTVTGLTNGTFYTFTVVATNAVGNSVASAASVGVTPISILGAPTSPVATASNSQASVAFSAPASNGGSAITGYTVTSSPGGLTATGANSPLTVSGLTNGTAYTFTVVASNAAGSSANSVASAAVTPLLLASCGAFVASGVYKVFACYNLGATDTTVDPNIPIQGIHGNYYQWGRNTVVADASSSAGPISGWDTTAAVNSAWTDGSKTANDPCPTGFRVPTKSQWDGVINTSLNTVSRTGAFIDSSTNFGVAIHFGPSVASKTLTLPASGYYDYRNGTLGGLGYWGFYWSSTENGTYAWLLGFTRDGTGTDSSPSTSGVSVRCISE